MFKMFHILFLCAFRRVLIYWITLFIMFNIFSLSQRIFDVFNNKYVNEYGALTTAGLLQWYTRVHLAVYACSFSCTRVYYMMHVFTFTRVYWCPYEVPACTRYISCVYGIDLMRVLLCYNTRRYNIEYTYTHFKVHAHAK